MDQVRQEHEHLELLDGPYQLPSLEVGDRTFCLFRDCEVIVTSWTDGPISWPRCQVPKQRGGCGLLVDEELARAIRTESAQVLIHWWGVSAGVVWRWRDAFGVGGHAQTPGSKRAVTRAARLGAQAVKGRTFSEEERQVKRENSTRLDTIRHARGKVRGGWTAEELALLKDAGLSNEEVAERTGRTVNAVRVKRQRVSPVVF